MTELLTVDTTNTVMSDMQIKTDTMILLFRATDGSFFTDSAILTVNIADVNDNTPVFVEPASPIQYHVEQSIPGNATCCPELLSHQSPV